MLTAGVVCQHRMLLSACLTCPSTPSFSNREGERVGQVPGGWGTPHSPRPRQPIAPSQLSRTQHSSPSSAGGRSNRSVCADSAPRGPQLPAMLRSGLPGARAGEAREGCGAQASPPARNAVTQPRKSCFHHRGPDLRTRRAPALEGAGPS
jgi:hypothetical protein